MSFSINGLVSGLDTTQIIADLMKIEKLPYNRLETKKSNLQAEQSIFRTINTKLSALETAANNLKLIADFSVFKGESSDASVLKVTAGESAKAGNYSVVVNHLAQGQIVKREDISAGGNNLATQLRQNGFVINGKEVQNITSLIDSNDSNETVLQKLSNHINANSSLYKVKVDVMTTTPNTAEANEQSNAVLALTISSTETGADAKVTTNFDAVNFFSPVQSAQDAEVVINGVKATRSSNTIDDLIQGVTLNLSKTGSTTVNVTTDTDKIVSKVESFVNAYNDLVSMIKDNLAKPSDDTKTNPLQGDTLLKDINDSLYKIFNQGIPTGVGNTMMFMENFGLSIDKGIGIASAMTGKITFDKELFKSKMETNSGDIVKMFAGSSSTTGIMSDLSTSIKDKWTASTGMIRAKITGYDSEIKMVDDRMISLENNLTMKEARLKLQFSNMEIMLSSLQNEQKWLASQFESLLGTNKK